MERAGRIATDRLDLVPLTPADADEMVGVLADPELYAFTGGDPPSLDELRRRYELQAAGRSPDRRETWLNWIVRRRTDGVAVGFVQATIRGEGTGVSADVAWVIGTKWQRQGFATEAASAMVAWLTDPVRRVATVTAHIHPGHAASEAVARRLDLEPTGEIEDGETVWRSTG